MILSKQHIELPNFNRPASRIAVQSATLAAQNYYGTDYPA